MEKASNLRYQGDRDPLPMLRNTLVCLQHELWTTKANMVQPGRARSNSVEGRPGLAFSPQRSVEKEAYNISADMSETKQYFCSKSLVEQGTEFFFEEADECFPYLSL